MSPTWADIWESIEDEIQVGDPVQIGAAGIRMAPGPELTVVAIERGMAVMESEAGGLHHMSLEVLMPHPNGAI